MYYYLSVSYRIVSYRTVSYRIGEAVHAERGVVKERLRPPAGDVTGYAAGTWCVTRRVHRYTLGRCVRRGREGSELPELERSGIGGGSR